MRDYLRVRQLPASIMLAYSYLRKEVSAL